MGATETVKPTPSSARALEPLAPPTSAEDFGESPWLLSADSGDEAVLGSAGPCGCRMRQRRRWSLSWAAGALVLGVLGITLACVAPKAKAPGAPAALDTVDTARHVLGLAAKSSSSKQPGKPLGKHIRNKGTGMCLDWGNIIITIIPCNQIRGMQQWHYAPDGRVTAVDGRCLDGGGKFVHVWDCSGTEEPPATQKWDFDAGTQQLKQGKVCLSAGTHKINMLPCSLSNKEQRWEMLSRLPPPGTTPLSTSKTSTSLTTTSKVAKSTDASEEAAPVEDAGMHEVVNIAHYPGICLTLGDAVGMAQCDSSQRGQQWLHDFSTGQIRSCDQRCLDASNPDLLEACRPLNPNQAWGINRDTGHIQTERGFCLHAKRSSKKESSMVTLKACERDDPNQQWNLKRMARATC